MPFPPFSPQRKKFMPWKFRSPNKIKQKGNEMFSPPILKSVTIHGNNKSKHSLDRLKKYFKNFLRSCPSEYAFPILLRHKQATIFFPNRIHRNVPSTAMRAVKMIIFEIVMIVADELHTFCSYRWISRELVYSNSWHFVWIFEALLVRPSSYAITTSFSPPDFSPSALSAMKAKKPKFKRL